MPNLSLITKHPDQTNCHYCNKPLHRLETGLCDICYQIATSLPHVSIHALANMIRVRWTLKTERDALIELVTAPVEVEATTKPTETKPITQHTEQVPPDQWCPNCQD